jgi:uncharacterized protein YecE (DUF72 family)
MQQSPTYQCHFGSAGWDHPDWDGSFYPEDLPMEWRLAFYSQIFSCVYLSYAEWSQAGSEALTQWVEDTPERFKFVLEVPLSGAGEDKKKLAILEPRTGLLLAAAGSEQVLWLDVKPDLKQLARRFQDLTQSDQPVYIICGTHDLEKMEKVKILLEVMGL